MSLPPEPHNWGRWGADDQRGALNLLTPEVVKAATGCVQQGRVISLSLPIKGSTSSSVAQSVPHLKGRPLPQHFMSVDGADYEAGVKQPAGGRGIADDALIVSPHGTTTHMDALCHMWTGKSIYNGHAASRIRDVPWPNHAGRVGPCRDATVCRALRALGASPAAAR